MILALLIAAYAGVHAEHAATFGAQPRQAPALRRAALPPATPGPDMTVYGYLAYWDADLNTVPWDDLSHIALFAAEVNPDGSLSYTSRWDDAAAAVAIAQSYGVKVHLCAINFSGGELSSLLGSASARASLISNLASWEASTGADGVNIDFEGLPSSRRAEMVSFVTDLDAAVGDVVLATPAVDWSDAWDYASLTQHADLFIMGYGYHWSGSSQAGPNDPLYGGGLWGSYALDWTVGDYVSSNGADPNRVILGLPLYGISWARSCAAGDVESAIPCSTSGTGSSIFYAEAQAQAATHGKHWEAGSATPWWDDGSRQGWFGDADSVALRAQYAKDQNIAGIGFWALNYDDSDPQLWSALRAVTHDEVVVPPDTADTGSADTSAPATGRFRASAGQPLLAYVRDRVALDGSASKAPTGQDITYAWVQRAGPTVSLNGIDSASPSFTVEAVGSYAFELTVGDDTDTTWVVAVDPAAGRRHRGCGCSSVSGWGGGTWLLGLVLVGVRRRW